MTYYQVLTDSTTDCIRPDGTTQGRELSLQLQCAYNPWTPAGAPDNRHFITEVDNCVYKANAWTTAGCPLECPVTNGALCSGQGICAYDKDLFAARCFCDDNYIESDCSKPANPFPAGAVAGIFFGGLTVGAAGLLGAAFYISRRAGAAVAQDDGFYSVQG